MEIHDHGHFWWANEELEEGSVAGLLTIDSSGLIQLETHQTLPGRSGIGGVFGQTLDDSIALFGCLKSDGRYIFLRGLTASQGRAGIISYEVFTARECFVSRKVPKVEELSRLRIPLDGLQQWIRPGAIDFVRPSITNDGDGNKLSASFELKSDDAWNIESGQVEIVHCFTGNEPGLWAHSINVAMSSHLVYSPASVATSEEMLAWYRAAQDLLMILANSNLTLKWPRVFWKDGGEDVSADFYFRRNTPSSNEARWHEILLPYARIRSTFGKMIETWIDRRKNLGPGINLYLGTRRNKALYAEHYFVNLVWGLEALARRIDSSASDDPKLKEKIQRLQAFVDGAEALKSSDRRFLRGLLDSRSSERPLSDRLYDLLRPVAIGIDDTKLKAFTKNCADLRNDLSHHGGERKSGDYESFISGVMKNSDALSKLYLLLIVNLLGVEAEELKNIVCRDPGSIAFKESFIKADLLPDVDLDKLLELYVEKPSAPMPQAEGDVLL
ncbi:HEPN domain-containing protein [Pseudomonas viridiflava]|uniref:ApeA N-terminal domain 1-containing protein n=1 Tax=Pseudomonas viridiflava TaxID=33069 RepID=UPI000F03B2B0|nr:HEPN domain-containing protein [Pseudomonas viridiflava]